MKALKIIAWILLVIGGLNWGLVGINMDWNVVNLIFGSVEWLERLIYILVGLSALWLIFAMKGCGSCSSKKAEAPAQPQM